MHHVLARGVEKRPIFDDDHDMSVFTERLAACVEETDTSVLAWVLMTNHLHLLTRTETVPLSTFMQKLLTGHALYYNKRHERVGHLFQNRFKSIIVQAEEYLMDLVRYIHRNPLRAGLVKFPEYLESYRWSGHRGILHRSTFRWMKRKEVLDHFPGDEHQRVSAYTGFLENDHSENSRSCLSSGCFAVSSKGLIPVGQSGADAGYGEGFRLLGTREFGLSVLKRLKEMDDRTFRTRSPSHDVIISLVRLVEDHWKLTEGSLRSGGRRESAVHAREALSFLLIDSLGLTLSDSASIVGVSRQGVCGAIERFRRRIAAEPETVGSVLTRAYRIIGQ